MLARLGRRYHLVAYDVRGDGASSRPRGAVRFTPEQAATEILEAIGADAPVAIVTHGARVMRALAFCSFAGPPNRDAGHAAGPSTPP